MPWCPKCGMEYREGIRTCYNCGGQPLVAAQPQKSKPEQSDWDAFFDKNSRDKAVFLQTSSTEIEADMTESLLRAYGIPVLRKYQQQDGYFKVAGGRAILGVDLYVPSSVLQQAQEILKAPHERVTAEMAENVPPEEWEEQPEPGYDAQKLRRITWKVFVGLLTALLAFALLAQYASQYIK